MGRPAIELAGKNFNRLKVIERVNDWVSSSGTTKNIAWKCLCSCGKECIVRTSKLVDKSTGSCGCHRTERSRKPRAPKGITGLTRLYHSYRHGAANRNHSFELTFSEFTALTSKNCHYCNRPPSQEAFPYKNNRNEASVLFGKYLYNGIDRVNNECGYVISNVVACCRNCNIAKASMTYADFIKLITAIYKNINTKVKNTKQSASILTPIQFDY